MSKKEAINWKLCNFDQLTSREVYLLAKLRVDVFVVEQACAYAELDGQDLLTDTTHILATLHRVPIAYARILAPGYIHAGANGSKHTAAAHIGRVVVAPDHRQQGLARTLMNKALQHCEHYFAGHDQALAAQVTVQSFYATLGFTPCSGHYLEDGIAHVDMVRNAFSKS